MTQKTPAQIRAEAEAEMEPLGAERLRLLAELEKIDGRLKPKILKARTLEVSLRRITTLTGVAPNTVRAWEKAENANAG
ncbi:hypothetical protein, partial [Streptomyces albiaxialis]|uniref:hypothetical protein n=1 Tax=Streptomyces albiaxialis TaxID=329523 RepID=UPI0031D9D9E7